MRRNLRKAAVELLPVLALTVIGFLLENGPEFGISSTGMWALLQSRRVLRDVSQGQPR
jgi:hypothetical protein